MEVYSYQRTVFLKQIKTELLELAIRITCKTIEQLSSEIYSSFIHV